MKVQAPRGSRIVSIGGTEVTLDETGIIEVPDPVGHDLIAYHRFKKAGPAEIITEAGKPKGKSTKIT